VSAEDVSLIVGEVYELVYKAMSTDGPHPAFVYKPRTEEVN
jgi:hypothetical protein